MLRRIENEIKAKMAERNDYQAYYYRPAMGKYHRIAKEEKEKMDAISGDDQSFAVGWVCLHTFHTKKQDRILVSLSLTEC